MRKKVLIIAYYWPPAGGPGVQRWLKFVKYLPDFDVEPILFVPENANYPITDSSLEKEVSSDIEVVKFPINEPYKLAQLFSKKKANTISRGIINEHKKQSLLEKVMLFIRGNFFIPDARVGWVKPSVSYLSKFISKNNIKTIITTGPPHSVHLIGMALKKKLDITWLTDFRDPWTTIGYHKKLKLTNAARKKHKKLEKAVLNSADTVIVTSYTTKKEFLNITYKPIAVITNGYDEEISQKVTLDEKFTLSHIGSLLSKRNPQILWKVLSELIQKEGDFKKDFQLNLVGYVGDNVLDSIENSSLTDYINKVGYVSHKESVMYQLKSQLLLLIEINSEETKSIIPGKLFEYLIAKRPIIAIGPIHSDIENIIDATNSGYYFEYSQELQLKRQILAYYRAYKSNTLKSDAENLEQYHRKSLTKQLSQLI